VRFDPLPAFILIELDFHAFLIRNDLRDGSLRPGSRWGDPAILGGDQNRMNER